MSDFTFTEGQTVRLDRVPHKVVSIHIDGTVTLIGPQGLRTVDSFRVTPAKRHDRVVTNSAPPPARRRGTR